MPRPDRPDPDPNLEGDGSLGPGLPHSASGPVPRTRPGPTRVVVDFRPYPTSPTRTRRSPARTSAADRARPQTAATPATVWFTPPTADTAAPGAALPSGPGGGWQTDVLARVLTSFSSFGAAVMVLPWPDLPTGGTDPDPDRSERRGSGLDTVVATALRLGRFPITTPTGPRPEPPPGGADTASADRPPSREAATLLITTMPSRVTASSPAADEVARRAAAALPVGGLLVVLTHCAWDEGVLSDPTGPMVTAAQNADLLYLQHIIAIHLPARDLRLHPRYPAPAAQGSHRRVHSDVLVFAQPRSSGSSDEPCHPEQPEPADLPTEGRP